MVYDVIIIGAGSVGVPTAMALGELGIKPLVIDMHPSPGQGENKHAIGGIRATHSDPGKILTGQRSLEIFATWQDRFGGDIEWLKGGYVFPVYRKNDEQLLKKEQLEQILLAMILITMVLKMATIQRLK